MSYQHITITYSRMISVDSRERWTLLHEELTYLHKKFTHIYHFHYLHENVEFWLILLMKEWYLYYFQYCVEFYLDWLRGWNTGQWLMQQNRHHSRTLTGLLSLVSIRKVMSQTHSFWWTLTQWCCCTEWIVLLHFPKFSTHICLNVWLEHFSEYHVPIEGKLEAGCSMINHTFSLHHFSWYKQWLGQWWFHDKIGDWLIAERLWFMNSDTPKKWHIISCNLKCGMLWFQVLGKSNFGKQCQANVTIKLFYSEISDYIAWTDFLGLLSHGMRLYFLNFGGTLHFLLATI